MTWVLPQEEKILTEQVTQLDYLILKPDNGKCGDQIIIGCVDDILERWKSSRYDAVAQILIKQPLLYAEKYKFDLRLYVLVTSVSPMTAFLATNGLARVCGVPWVQASEDNKGMMQMHLSNAAINHAGAASSDEAKPPECKQELSAVLEQLRQQGVDVEKTWAEIHRQVSTVLTAMQPALIPHHTEQAFQLLGFDFMLDAAQRVWYIEVNSTPSFKIDGRADEKVKPAVVKGALDVLFSNEEHGIFERVPMQTSEATTGDCIPKASEHARQEAEWAELQEVWGTASSADDGQLAEPIWAEWEELQEVWEAKEAERVRALQADD
jgi:hypothetical protein